MEAVLGFRGFRGLSGFRGRGFRGFRARGTPKALFHDMSIKGSPLAPQQQPLIQSLIYHMKIGKAHLIGFRV